MVTSCCVSFDLVGLMQVDSSSTELLEHDESQVKASKTAKVGHWLFEIETGAVIRCFSFLFTLHAIKGRGLRCPWRHIFHCWTHSKPVLRVCVMISYCRATFIGR